MKVLVIGGAGFIGSNICLRLLNKGHEVICLDNISSGAKRNMMEFMYNPLFHFIIHDIITPIPVSNVDAVVFCALPTIQDDVLHFLKTCSFGAFNIAGIARRNESRIIWVRDNDFYYDFSFKGVTNGVWETPMKDISFSPKLDFMLERQNGNAMIESIFSNYTYLDVRSIYTPTVYGPKMNKDTFLGGVFNKLLSKKEKELKLPLDLNLSSISALYIDDLMDSVSYSLEAPKNIHRDIIFNPPEINLKKFIDYINTAQKEVVSGSNNFKLGYPLGGSWTFPEDLKLWPTTVEYAVGVKKTAKFHTEGPDRDYELV
jgi:UDP-glucuronate decarboxylase